MWYRDTEMKLLKRNSVTSDFGTFLNDNFTVTELFGIFHLFCTAFAIFVVPLSDAFQAAPRIFYFFR